MRPQIYLILILLVSFLSCSDDPDYPIVPEIKYESFFLYEAPNLYGDTILTGELKFTVLDGDGDIGYKDQDSLIAPSTYDTSKVYVTMYEKRDGVYDEIIENDTLNYHIPYLTSAGNNKSLKAEIVITFEYYLEPTLYDTIQYDFYVIDRAFNKSNIEHTYDVLLY